MSQLVQKPRFDPLAIASGPANISFFIHATFALPSY